MILCARAITSSSNVPVSWLCAAKLTQNSNDAFIDDSGASHHVCGGRNLFTSLQEIDEKTLMTANRNITYNQVRAINVT